MPSGFFTNEQQARQRRPPPKRTKPMRKLDCNSCGLYKHAASPKMDVRGQGRKGVLVIGEGPGETEDAENDILVGKTGQRLRRDLKRVMGIDLERDCWRINGINCFPGSIDYEFTNNQIACCRQVKVNPALAELQPRHIILLGGTALQSFWGERHSELRIMRFRGRVLRDKPTGAWVYPLLHPSFVERSEGNRNVEALWRRDLECVAGHLDAPPPQFPDPADELTIIKDFDKVCAALGSVAQHAYRIVFDYETSGLKPVAPGHRIHTISIAAYYDDGREVYSFPFQYPGHFTDEQQATIRKKLRKILANPRIKKVAHNLKFEDHWSSKILGVDVEGWECCTMIDQHIEDNTERTTSLKLQAWWRWGVEGYGNEFRSYAEGALSEADKAAGRTKASTHSFNRVHEMPLDKLLEYGGFDGVLEAWLYDEQQPAIRRDKGLRTAQRLFKRAALMFCDLESQGIPVDEEYYDTKMAELGEYIEEAERALYRSREAKVFHQRTGRPLKYSSDHDLRKLLFDFLGYEPTKRTDTGMPSVDAEALHDLNLSFTNAVLDLRKYKKIRTTYMDQIRRESVAGRVYPTTNLHIPRTYRPSMDGPNMANTPKREEEAKLLCRRGILAPPGYKLMEADYGSIEVCGIAWYSRDAMLLRYLHDPTSDMHRDEAQAIFDIPPDMWDQLDPKATKVLRFFAKNQWVFPEFYGDWYKSCARMLWDKCARLPIGDGKGTTIKQHLGMSYRRFEEKIREHENDFWRKYKGVRKWQESLEREYQRNGYLETFFGFQYRTFMKKNNLYNYKVQGTAFHLLLWAMCELYDISIDRDWNTHIFWQIYDSIISGLWPEEQEEVVAAFREVMVDRALEKFPWINTPLKAEIEITNVNGTFADLEELDETDNAMIGDQEEAA